MLRKILIRTVLGLALGIIALLAIANYAVGYSPTYLYNAPGVATGIGAKLACSARYVSGFDVEQTSADIAVYSPILGMLDYVYDDAEQSVSASLFGIKTRSASHLPGIGCALDYKGDSVRNTIAWPTLQSPRAAWPRGNVIFTINDDVQQKLDAMLAADNADGHDTRALLVAHKGKIVAESYAPGIDAETPLLGWSMTKSVNALILGHLEMLGDVAVYEKELYPHWRNDPRSDISLENLLQMTDGLDFAEEYDPGYDATKMLFQVRDAAEFTAAKSAARAAGVHFNYSSGTANILADLVQQRIEGDVQADVNFIVNEFFRPAGITSLTYEMDPSGLFIGSSYLYATARDWARIGQIMLNGGEINGTRLVTEDFVARSVEPNASENERAYGYQWWLNRGDGILRWPSLPVNAYAAMGNRDQRVTVLPDEELVIVRLGWSPKEYIDNRNFSEIASWFK